MKLLDPTKIVDKSVKRDRGDISGLAQSIEKNGLLHPLVVNQNDELIIGGRRLEAVKLLKMKEVPCYEIVTKNRDDELRKALDENIQRKDMTLSEKVEIAKALRPQLEEEAKKRQGTRADLEKQPSEESSESRGTESRQIVAKQLNTSFDTLRKAEEIVDSKDEVLIKEMDKKGKVDAVHKKLKKKKNDIPITLESQLIQIKKKIEKLNQSLLPLLEHKDDFLSARCQKSKAGQDFIYVMAELFSTVHVLMSKKRKEADLIESFKLLVQSKKQGGKEV